MNIDEQAAADAIMSAKHSDAFDREACVKILRDNLQQKGGDATCQPQTRDGSTVTETSELTGNAAPTVQSAGAAHEPRPICDGLFKQGWHIENTGGIRVPVKDDDLPAWAGAASFVTWSAQRPAAILFDSLLNVA